MKSGHNKLYTKILSSGVFMFLMMSSLLAGHQGYCKEKDYITSELNKALTLTINKNKYDIITPDTIRAYRHMQNRSDGKVLFAVADRRFCNNISNHNLRHSAYLTFDIVDAGYSSSGHDYSGTVSSDTVILQKEYCGETIALRGYARLSTAAIFRLSDQRLSSTLFLIAMAWAVVSMLYLRRRRATDDCSVRYGGLVLSETDRCFYTDDNTPVRFTPMQEQLMKMFIESPTHSLSKEEICTALWPKKDDANDTLYTLIRRIKPVVEDNTNLTITSDRSIGYTLKIR